MEVRADPPPETVVYTNQLNIGAAIILFVLFALSAIAIFIRSVLLLWSKKHPPRQTRTHFFLFFVICSAAGRATFFLLLHVSLDLHVYFFLWFLPEFLNLAAFVMLLRSWIRVWATSRHLATFTYRSTRLKLFVLEIVTISFIELAQTVLFLVMLIIGENYFDFMQRLDSWYMGALELLLISLSGVSIAIVKYLERRAKRRHDIIEVEQPFLSLFNRTDAVMLVWVFARFVRGFDCLMSLNSDWDQIVASSELYMLYVGPFYLFAELLPLASLLFGKVIETLDYGTTEYKLLNLLPTLFPSPKLRPLSTQFSLNGTATERDITHNYTSDDESDDDEPKFGTEHKALLSSSGRLLPEALSPRISGGPTRRGFLGESGVALPSGVGNSVGPSSSASSAAPSGKFPDTAALIKQLISNPRVRSFIIPFDELQIIQRIGGGAGGIVMKAVWNDMMVAVKQLNQLLQEGRDLVDFLNEIEIMSSLRHQNIVTFYGACIQPPHVCIVSEYLKRDNLRTVLDDESVRISPQLKARMVRDICKGMSVIHKAKIIHRDLKPQNLMVDKHYRIKVGDFGVSRMLPGGNSAPFSGYVLSIAGSSVYIAPEVYNLRYTHKCDVYSFGVILWEIWTRQYLTLRPEELVHGMRPDIPSDCPALYAYLIRACWDADPLQRPEFRAIVELLKQWKGREADFNFSDSGGRRAETGKQQQRHSHPMPAQPNQHQHQQQHQRNSLQHQPTSAHRPNKGDNDQVVAERGQQAQVERDALEKEESAPNTAPAATSIGSGQTASEETKRSGGYFRQLLSRGGGNDDEGHRARREEEADGDADERARSAYELTGLTPPYDSGTSPGGEDAQQATP